MRTKLVTDIELGDIFVHPGPGSLRGKPVRAVADAGTLPFGWRPMSRHDEVVMYSNLDGTPGGGGNLVLGRHAYLSVFEAGDRPEAFNDAIDEKGFVKVDALGTQSPNVGLELAALQGQIHTLNANLSQTLQVIDRLVTQIEALANVSTLQGIRINMLRGLADSKEG